MTIPSTDTSQHAPGTIVKKCACGRSYTLPEWLALRPAAGGAIGDDFAGGILLYRNCHCGSTMARRPVTLPIQAFTDDEIRDAAGAVSLPAWLHRLTDDVVVGTDPSAAAGP